MLTLAIKIAAFAVATAAVSKYYSIKGERQIEFAEAANVESAGSDYRYYKDNYTDPLFFKGPDENTALAEKLNDRSSLAGKLKWPLGAIGALATSLLLTKEVPHPVDSIVISMVSGLIPSACAFAEVHWESEAKLHKLSARMGEFDRLSEETIQGAARIAAKQTPPGTGTLTSMARGTSIFYGIYLFYGIISDVVDIKMGK